MKLISLFFLLICSTSFAQKIRIKGIFSENELSRYYETEIFKQVLKANTLLESVYNTDQYSLKINIDDSKIYHIEGIESKYSGTAKIIFSLKNTSLSKDSTWTYPLNIKAPNKQSLLNEILKQFEKTSGGEKNANTIVNLTKSNCQKTLTYIEKLKNQQNWRESYLLAKTLEGSECQTDAKKSILEIEESYAKDYCDNILPKIKILTQSGVEYKIQKGVDMLYLFPKNAKCKKEIEEISKQVSETYLKSSGKSINVSLDKNLDSIFKN